jgi:hypothetical protein
MTRPRQGTSWAGYRTTTSRYAFSPEFFLGGPVVRYRKLAHQFGRERVPQLLRENAVNRLR